ncbi:hypothetical protein LPY66_07335 [Dehalobacter sp. DCM]|uniref:hypothetical protein n=1 Tax=Dehalobacter sp. DCM TaxID=2907827 RepID=UPI003081FD33|nr:hypothetical protein LPY66_07335 [Dehalobacter sp. DCM]
MRTHPGHQLSPVNFVIGMRSDAHEHPEELPYWTQRRTDIQARDVIIEEKSSDILVLEMTGLGKLYTQELLNELLRKGEDLWPVKFKQAIARFQR